MHVTVCVFADKLQGYTKLLDISNVICTDAQDKRVSFRTHDVVIVAYHRVL